MAPNNQNSLTLFLLLIIITQSILITESRKTPKTDANIIDQTCKQTPYYNKCRELLNSDKRSVNADVTGLALIVVDLLKTETTKSAAFVKTIQGQNPTPEIEKALKSCERKYGVILTDNIPVTIQAVSLGNPKFGESGMNDAAIEAGSCEDGFKAGKSPLSKTNKILTDISHVASSIIRLLL